MEDEVLLHFYALYCIFMRPTHGPFSLSTSIDKTRRHQTILGILEDQIIGSQDELALALEGMEITVTQATLSRDLRDLGVARVPASDGYRYVTPEPENAGQAAGLGAERLRVIAALEVTAVDANDSVIAMRTIQGRAEGVAAYLDGLGLEEVLATIAGDDTVIVYPRRTRQCAKLRRQLAEMFGTH
jgi:transcriptional regulator of arginine metabolism